MSVTTTGTPNFWRFSMCFSRFTMPFSRASRFSADNWSLGTPPLYLRALTVATRTTASGLSPALRHLMSRNFSAPRSAPKPASVTTTSASFRAVFVALTLLHPWAMLANGPPCTRAPVCSRVWIRLGFNASLRRAAMEPTAWSCSAVTGSPAKL